MSKIRAEHVFTSESVSEGHPDKVCDQISDAILDACLAQDPESRVACETLTTTNLVVISGEITTRAKVNWQDVALNAIRKIGYNDPAVGFCADDAKVMICIHRQSPDISQGVTEGMGRFTEQGAGDQGMMFGYASNETPDMMPATIYYAHKIVEELARLRKSDPVKYRYLRPDSKSQVSIRYVGGRPKAVETIVVSHQHTPDMPAEWLEALVRDVVKRVIPAELLGGEIRYYVNPTGRFEVGGPHGDTGLTGRKIIVDTYGTGVLADDGDLEKVIREVFSLKPAEIVRQLGLKHPGQGWCYQDTAAYGHFGRAQFPWEKIDRVAELKAAAEKFPRK